MIVPPPDDYDDNYDYFEMDKDTGRPADENTVNYERIKAHAALPVWMCPLCNCKNSHDNQRCAYCWIRNKIITDKPNGNKGV